MKQKICTECCRICLRKNKKQRSLFYKSGDKSEKPAFTMITKLTGIALSEASVATNSEPGTICKSCELSLNMAFEFVCMTLKSQRLIEQHIKQRQLDAVSVCSSSSNESDAESYFKKDIDEEFPDEVSMEENMFEESQSASAQQEEAELAEHSNMDGEFAAVTSSEDMKGIKISASPMNELTNEENMEDAEFLEEDYIEFVVEEIPFSNDKEIITCDNFDNIDVENIEEFQKSLKGERAISMADKTKSAGAANLTLAAGNTIKQIKISNANFVKKIDIINQRDAFAPTEASENVNVNNMLKRRRNKPKDDADSAKGKSNPGGFICDVCGNVFAKRCRMMEHRRRHDNELSYACELCDERFNLREKLRKHMYTHTGGKPFKCSMCSRTFFYESMLKAHENIHAGIKPYTCETCNKSFAYSHALKKHILTHTDIKYYHCSYCAKDFRLQHHMKQHEETKLHQTAVRAATEGRLQFIKNEELVEND